MQTKRITCDFAELDRVETLALEAFPPEEYLAPQELLRMADNGEVELWALYDAEDFVGFMVVSAFEHMAYLFFLAIEAQARSKGYGGQALRALEALYPDKQQVVDFEKVEENAPNYAQRVTRRAFYLRNGYKETGKFLSYLGVDYEVLCKAENFDFDCFRRMMQRFSIKDFAPVYSVGL